MLTYVALLLGSWLLWRVLRWLGSTSPLSRLPGPRPASFLLGNVFDSFHRQGWGFHDDIAKTYGPVSKLAGPFGATWLYVADPTALYSIILKDHDSYDEVEWLVESARVMLGPALLSTMGTIHKNQRKMILPLFSPKELKPLVPIFNAVTRNLVTAISAQVQTGAAEVDMLTWMGRTALELIGQAGIGHSFDPLVENAPPDAYTQAVKEFMPYSSTPLIMGMRIVSPYLIPIGPKWLQRKIIEAIPSKDLKRLTEIVDVLEERSLEILRAKKAAWHAGRLHDADSMLSQVGQGKDIMSILLQANLEAPEHERLPDDQLTAMMSTLLFAAMDTTSNAMSRALQYMAQYPHTQEQLRREVIEASKSGELDYDMLHALPYLDAICRETLRLDPPAPIAFRASTKDTVLPFSEPIVGADGTTLSEIPVPRGTNIMVSILNCNRNPAVWGDDAGVWRPERWLAPMPGVEKATIPGVYSHLMTFMGGGRSCVGFKFSQLEMKVVLAELVREFSFELLAEKPVVWNISSVSYPSISTESTKPEMWMRVRKVAAGP